MKKTTTHFTLLSNVDNFNYSIDNSNLVLKD